MSTMLALTVNEGGLIDIRVFHSNISTKIISSLHYIL